MTGSWCLVLWRFQQRNFALVPTKCPNMFSGRVAACPCPEFRNKFPNLYLEPMQYDNSNEMWQDVTPYIIINLNYDRDIYISKDTVVTYAYKEDSSCKYLEVNEVIESTEFWNWTPRQRQNIVNSDLVFSPAQVTKQSCRFEILNKKYPEVFYLSNQDTGYTNLVTMHVDTGDSLPICQKPYILPLKHYSWVQQEIETLEHVGVIKKRISPWVSPIIVVPKKSAPGEPLRWRMCINFRK